MTAVSPDRFLDALRRSGLLTADQLEAQLRRSAAEGPPADAPELAARFVRDGLLTPFQADQLLRGDWRSLVVAGKYRVLARLGAGGMGQVFLAEHVVLRRRSALKVLPARMTADPAAIERFHREARAVAALDHPNIVRAYDVDSDDGLHFLVMEYVEGLSLQDLIGRRGPVEPDAAANYVAQAAEGLQHAHEAGWVHRDVKPANLLLDRFGIVKVLDLGLARLLGDDVDPLTYRTDTVLGTADYLAPEQANDSHEVDIRADIYSLGATFYFLLTARPPFSEGTAAQRVLWHQTRLPKPVRDRRPDVPAGLAAVLDRMLAKDPADRFATPAEVAEALRPWAGETTFPPPAELVGAGPAGGRSGAQSSWAKSAGQSSSKLTTASGRRIPRPVAADTAGAGETGPMTPAPVTMAVRARRRWPVIIAGLAVVALVAAGVAAFRPKAPPPAGATPAPPPDPAGEIRKFIGHTGAVENVAFTPDGTRLVTASQDTTARVWDVATGKELVTFTGHNEAVRGLAVLPDGKRVATAGWGGHVRLWDLDTGRELRDYKGHTDEVWWVACDAAGRRLLTAGKDRTVRLWDVETGRELKRLSGGHLKTVTAAVFLPDGHRAVSAGEDGILCLWDLDTGKVTLRKQAPKMVYRLSLCPNGRRILFGCDRTVVRWDPDGAVHPAPVATTDAVESAVGLPDGRLVLAVKDGTVRVWGLNPDRELHRFPASEQPVLAVAVAPDGKHVASGGRDKLARLWRLPVK